MTGGMTRVPIITCVILAAVSCGTAARMPVSGHVTVLRDGMTAVWEDGNSIRPFALKQMTVNFDTLYPVLAGRALEGYEGWLEVTQDDARYRSLLSEDGYHHWERLSSRLVRHYAKDCESVLFSVPGLLVACIQQERGIDKMSPRPDCAITGSGRYLRIDTDSEPSIVEKDRCSLVFRSIVRDRRHRALVAVDRIYLVSDGRMLCLIYLCTGNYEYGLVQGRTFGYCGNVRFSKFDPLDNIPMAYEYLYRCCDGISASLIKASSRP